MTKEDKQEIAEIIRQTMQEHGYCALGIKPETAHELISFADTWKTMRRYAIGGFITGAAIALLSALWLGIKQSIK